MRYYSMSRGMNERLWNFSAETDTDALVKAIVEEAEYCVRVTPAGMSMYTIKEYVDGDV